MATAVKSTTPTKSVPVKRTPTKAPAAKAPAKAAAKKAPAQKAPLGKKVRWTIVQKFANGKAQNGLGRDGNKYEITRDKSGDYVGVLKPAKGASKELGRGSFGTAYWACVRDNQGSAAKTVPAKAPAKKAPAKKAVA